MSVEPRRYLVTGGAGFIGSALVRHLIATTPHHVAVLDKLTYAGSLASLKPVAKVPRFSFVQGDIADRRVVSQLIEMFRPDALLHLAAETHVDRSIDGAATFIESNIVGTYTLLEEATGYWAQLDDERRAGFRFLHVSTDEVFGSLGKEGAFTEESPYRPNSPYAASKAASDHLARAWHRTHGLPVIVSHSTNNYGPYQFPEKLIPLTILNCLAGLSLPLYGTGDNIRDWLFVDDHAEALVQVVQTGRPGETYGIGGGVEKSNLDVVRAVCAAMDAFLPDAAFGRRDRLIEFVADRPGHDARYAMNTSKVRAELGWTPHTSFESGLSTTVRWYLDNRPWWDRIRSEIYRGERLGLGL